METDKTGNEKAMEAQGGDSSVTRAREAVREGIGSAREKLSSVGGTVGERVRGASKEVREKAERASEVARERYDSAREGLRHGYDRARKDFDQLTADVNVFVRDNPGRAVLIAASVGFVVGLLVRGSGDRRR